jgi:hypothetical protein
MPPEEMSQDEIERRMKELEEDPPKDLKDWPKERELRMQTFGGREGTHGYHEGVEEKLGPSDVAHHEDGSVTVKGEPVDNPEDFKGERIVNVADEPQPRD